MANYDDVLNLLKEMEDDDLFDLWCEYCYSASLPNNLHFMIDLDDEVDNYRVYNTMGAYSSYIVIYHLFDHAIGLREFDIDDCYFVLEDDELHSYICAADYVSEYFNDIANFIIDNNDCLGNTNIDLALNYDEEEDDD